MTGRVDIVWRFYETIAKKLKLRVTGFKKAHIFEHLQINKPKIMFFCSQPTIKNENNVIM